MNAKKNIVPEHVAIIMDGNRRWAQSRNLPVLAGHRHVVEHVIEDLIEEAGHRGIKYITFWAWSTENWKRGEVEVMGIMKLFRWALERKARKMIEKGARLRVIGDIESFPKDIRTGIQAMMKDSEQNTAITVTFALNYGGRDEISRAVVRGLSESLHVDSGVDGDNPNHGLDRSVLSSSKRIEEMIGKNLDTAGMPDPDLIIRPGGTKRLSGFMLWQVEYAELYFSEVLMPDFSIDEFTKALEDFSSRSRRFGG